MRKSIISLILLCSSAAPALAASKPAVSFAIVASALLAVFLTFRVASVAKSRATPLVDDSAPSNFRTPAEAR